MIYLVHKSYYKTALDKRNGRMYTVLGQNRYSKDESTALLVSWGTYSPEWIDIEHLEPCL